MKIASNKIILIAFLLLSFGSIAQDKSSGYLLVRGKASSFFVLEDLFFRNANIGFEYRFKEQHSIGFDYVYFRWRYENDTADSGGIETGSGYSAFSRRTYINVDYRYYLHPPRKEYNVDPYLSAFVKTGVREVWSENSFTPTLDDLLKHHSTFQDIGLAIGMHARLPNYPRLGWDLNVGFIHRFSQIPYEKRLENNVISEATNTNSNFWRPHARINFYWKFLNW